MTEPYSKSNPFLATITDRYPLSAPGLGKHTFHITLSLEDSNINYKVGDSIAIYPTNDPEIVEKTLKALHATGEELIHDKQNQPHTFLNFLIKKSNLIEVPRKLIGELAARQTNVDKKKKLEELLAEGQREKLKDYQASHEVWDSLLENQEVRIFPQEFSLMLQPMLPRFYSISSAISVVGEEVHLTVAEVIYQTNGYERRGTCTHYLCNLAPMHVPEIPIYIQPANGFTLPVDSNASVIMIGPGTGVAPFRAFMQERQSARAPGKNWLFFGEKNRDSHFFYKNYWQELVENGRMRLSTAFSRDQEHKIYVQHRLLEHGEELYHWLNEGAHFYVCGDASRMAKDVDAALHQIIQKHGKYDEQEAREYVKKLRANKRYLRDVY